MIILLGLPRTCMKIVQNVVSNQGIRNYLVRSDRDFYDAHRQMYINDDGNIKIYFILRDPVERIIREYMNQNQNRPQNESSLAEYLVDKRRHNKMCKFILCSEEDITDDIFKRVIERIDNGTVQFDIFSSDKTDFKTLKAITGIDMYDFPITNEYKLTKCKRMHLPRETNFMIKELNSYDVKLYELLSKRLKSNMGK